MNKRDWKDSEWYKLDNVVTIIRDMIVLFIQESTHTLTSVAFLW